MNGFELLARAKQTRAARAAERHDGHGSRSYWRQVEIEMNKLRRLDSLGQAVVQKQETAN